MDVLCGIFIAFALQGAWARKGYGPGEQEWGHVTVREGAHMFYWLYYVQDDNLTPADVPTIVWLEGVGVDSSGFGNFGDIGPLFPDGTARNTTWVKKANILFVDNPVGVGYSYVEDLKLITETREEVANDMVALMRNVLEKYPVLKQSPIHFFGRCYGASMGLVSAIALDKLIKSGEIDMKLGSTVMMGSWINPPRSYEAFADYLTYQGMINENDEAEIKRLIDVFRKTIEAEDKQNLLKTSSELVEFMRVAAFGQEMLNTIFPIPFAADFADYPVAAGELHHPLPNKDESEALLRSDELRDLLGIEDAIEFNRDGYEVIKILVSEIFMRPILDELSYALDNTDIKVFVISGQFNAYFNAIGARNGLTSLQWSGAEEWKTAPTKPFISDGILNGYSRSAKNLQFLVIDRAGHMIPTDNPSAADEFLRQIFEK